MTCPLIVTQLPVGTDAERRGATPGNVLRAPYGDGARLLLVLPNGETRVLSQGFHSACDPDVSFDASRILFAGKRATAEPWSIYEMAADGSGVRQITRDTGNCRSPGYQGTLYTIIAPGPWYQLTFVSDAAGALTDDASRVATHLYSCRLDGTAARRLTFNVSGDSDPCVTPDGRLLYAAWQRSTLARGPLGRVGLFGVNTDGADCALFAADEGRRVKHMPCVTTGGLAVFVEADQAPWDGAGALSCVTLRRPLHSYRRITREADGLFHSPSPLPDGGVLVSRRPRRGAAGHGVCRLDPATGRAQLVFDDPAYHDIQAKAIHPRPEPDGRSSVVTEEDPNGKLYCLNVYVSDLPRRQWLPPGAARRVRVVEGVPLRAEAALRLETRNSKHETRLAPRRILGETDIRADGSFNIEVPANAPLELQLLDADGLALRTCGWIWAKNHEARGCIGCHEDGELTPENSFRAALDGPSVRLCPPVEGRRTVDFRRDILPIVNAKCAPCHKGGDFPGRHVHPGTARTSPLIWRLLGRNASRPWDGTCRSRPPSPMPPAGAAPLTADEKRAVAAWVDLGATLDEPSMRETQR